MNYPVQLEVTSPPKFDRIQLLLRLALAIVLGWIGISGGWVMWFLYLTLPVFAGILVSTRGAPYYVDTVGPRLWRFMDWLFEFSAYMLLLTDRFPVGEEDGAVRTELQRTGHPTTGSALLRLLTSLPSLLVLGILAILSAFVFLISAVVVLFGGDVPVSLLAYQRGFLRWHARLIAYHASLVDEYPPFTFEATHAMPGDRATLA